MNSSTKNFLILTQQNKFLTAISLISVSALVFFFLCLLLFSNTKRFFCTPGLWTKLYSVFFYYSITNFYVLPSCKNISLRYYKIFIFKGLRIKQPYCLSYVSFFLLVNLLINYSSVNFEPSKIVFVFYFNRFLNCLTTQINKKNTLTTSCILSKANYF